HLLLLDITGGLDYLLFVLAPEECHQQDVFRFENGIALKFANPVAVWSLQREKETIGPKNGIAQWRERYGLGISGMLPRQVGLGDGIHGSRHGIPLRFLRG